MKRFMAATIAAVILSGCATASQRYVAFPTKGQDATQQATDQTECEDIASGKRGSAAQSAIVGTASGVAIGATVGAVLGAIAGAFLGDAGSGAAIGAALGGASGGISGLGTGVGSNENRYTSLYRACMVARGYATGGG